MHWRGLPRGGGVTVPRGFPEPWGCGHMVSGHGGMGGLGISKVFSNLHDSVIP